MSSVGRSFLFLLAVMATGLPVCAQSDEQIREQERQDRLYLERLLKAKQQSEAGKVLDSEQERRTLVEEYVAAADELIRDQNYRSTSTEHYRVKTDDPRVDVKAAAQLLESFEAFFTEFWSRRATLRPAEGPSQIYLFYSFFKYNELLTGNPRFAEFRPAGHYRPVTNVVVIHADAVPPSQLGEVLVHEAAHQLVTMRLRPNGTADAPWLDEGLAEYFGATARDGEGRFREGKVGGKSARLVKGPSTDGSSLAEERLSTLRRLLKSDPAWNVDALVRMRNRQEFFGPGADGRYAASWLLVHFLLHGDGGARAAAFARLLAFEGSAGADADAFYETLGLEPAALQNAFVSYVRSFKVR